jgi:hypothetical protein
MRRTSIRSVTVIATLVLAAYPFFAQEPAPAAPAPAAQAPATIYQPKFAGDPARSDSEAELVHSGSFTKRMVNPNRGDYTVGFEGKKDSYILTLTPNHLDAQHRSFYAEDDGKIHADEEKPADDKSPVVK